MCVFFCIYRSKIFDFSSLVVACCILTFPDLNTFWVMLNTLLNTFESQKRRKGHTLRRHDYAFWALIASLTVCPARLMLSSFAWAYILNVTAVSLWPNRSETLTTSAPFVMAMLAELWRSLWGWKSAMP